MSNPYTAPAAGPMVDAPESADRWRPGTLGNRVAAAFVDLVLVSVIWLPVVWLLDLVVHSDGLAFGALVLLALLYGTLMESSPWQGTVGFRVNKLRVVREDGSSLSVVQALIRTVLRVSLGSVFVTWLVPAVTSRNRALWDYPAGAFVIGSKRRARTEDALAKLDLNQEID